MKVKISNIDAVNPAGCTTYTNTTSKTISVQANQVLPFTIKLSSCDASTASRVVKIFIDYNNNGTFTDPGEEVGVSSVLAGGAVTYSGNLNIQPGLTTGYTTLMRIVAQETTDTSLVKPCGLYPNGETQDYTIIFAAPANDVGVGAVVDPLPGTCQADSQRITVRIRNAGTSPQSNVPVQLKVLSGNNTIVDVSTICPLPIPAMGSILYTFQPAFHLVAGTTYIVLSYTVLPGDQYASNDANVDTITVSAGSETISGEAEICSANSAGLRANTIDSSDAVSWFDSQLATTPIATGRQANTTVIPADKTYYLGLNEISGSIGPKNKFQFSDGGYNFFQGNFVKFHNDVPLTIASTRLYVGAGGSVDFIVADLADYDSCTGQFSYFPISGQYHQRVSDNTQSFPCSIQC